MGSSWLEVLTTHIQRDEVNNYGNSRERGRQLGVLARAREVPTNGFVPGISRVEDAAMVERAEDVTRFIGSKEGPVPDALISSTAMFHGATLVTNDKEQRRLFEQAGGVAMSSTEFIAWLSQNDPDWP